MRRWSLDLIKPVQDSINTRLISKSKLLLDPQPNNNRKTFFKCKLPDANKKDLKEEIKNSGLVATVIWTINPEENYPWLGLMFGSRLGLVLGGGNQTIAPEENDSLVRVRVCVRVSFGTGGIFLGVNCTRTVATIDLKYFFGYFKLKHTE